jgi:hypothetical protein
VHLIQIVAMRLNTLNVLGSAKGLTGFAERNGGPSTLEMGSPVSGVWVPRGASHLTTSSLGSPASMTTIIAALSLPAFNVTDGAKHSGCRHGYGTTLPRMGIVALAERDRPL